MENRNKIPKAIVDLVRNNIESRIKIIRHTDDFIQYKVMGYSEVYNIDMTDKKPKWFEEFENKQNTFNNKIESKIDAIRTDLEDLTTIVKKNHPTDFE